MESEGKGTAKTKKNPKTPKLNKKPKPVKKMSEWTKLRGKKSWPCLGGLNDISHNYGDK